VKSQRITRSLYPGHVMGISACGSCGLRRRSVPSMLGWTSSTSPWVRTKAPSWLLGINLGPGNLLCCRWSGQRLRDKFWHRSIITMIWAYVCFLLFSTISFFHYVLYYKWNFLVILVFCMSWFVIDNSLQHAKCDNE